MGKISWSREKGLRYSIKRPTECKSRGERESIKWENAEILQARASFYQILSSLFDFSDRFSQIEVPDSFPYGESRQKCKQCLNSSLSLLSSSQVQVFAVFVLHHPPLGDCEISERGGKSFDGDKSSPRMRLPVEKSKKECREIEKNME